jgi:hypothetical protein
MVGSPAGFSVSPACRHRSVGHGNHARRFDVSGRTFVWPPATSSDHPKIAGFACNLFRLADLSRGCGFLCGAADLLEAPIEGLAMKGEAKSLFGRVGPFATQVARLLPVVVIAGLFGWTLSEPPAATGQTAAGPAAATGQDLTPADAAPTTVEANPPAASAEAPPVNGLKISSQSWRRGGLGSKALITFTLRNDNDYAVKDIEIACVFSRRDGSHLTDRKRIIPDTVNMKSRKTFARLHIGFVNIYANKAKCTPIGASRV